MMNFTKSILMFTFSGLVCISCKQNDSAAPQAEANAASVSASDKTPINPANLETASFTVEGMTCAVGCAKTIQARLSAAPGVQNATVDFEKKTATVEFDSGLQNPESLVKIVEETADGKTYMVSNVHASKDHAMFLPQDQEKEKPVAKSSSKDSKKKAKEAKGCCAGKSHCAMDEKKA